MTKGIKILVETDNYPSLPRHLKPPYIEKVYENLVLVVQTGNFVS